MMENVIAYQMLSLMTMLVTLKIINRHQSRLIPVRQFLSVTPVFSSDAPMTIQNQIDGVKCAGQCGRSISQETTNVE